MAAPGSVWVAEEPRAAPALPVQSPQPTAQSLTAGAAWHTGWQTASPRQTGLATALRSRGRSAQGTRVPCLRAPCPRHSAPPFSERRAHSCSLRSGPTWGVALSALTSTLQSPRSVRRFRLDLAIGLLLRQNSSGSAGNSHGDSLAPTSCLAAPPWVPAGGRGAGRAVCSGVSPEPCPPVLHPRF